MLVAACGQASGTLAPSASGIPTSVAGSPAGTAAGSAPPSSPGTPSAEGTSAAETVPSASDLGGRLVATIDGIRKPCAMVVTATDVWVTGNQPSVLARIDPGTNAIKGQTPMEGSPCGIAVGPDGRLWVALLSIGRVVAVDPGTGEVVARIDGLGSQLWDLKAGFGSIWVVDRSKRELLRIDPADAAVVARIAIGPSGSGLAIAGGAVWVVDEVDSTIRRVDPATDAISQTAKLRRGSVWFANDDSTLLVTNRLDGSITPIDPQTGAAGPPIEGATSPLDGTIAGGRAYFPDAGARTLVEVDLATMTIDSVSRLVDAKNPFVAEPAFGDVWVLDYGGERIWRIRPRP
jgi:streptogramin lyase